MVKIPYIKIPSVRVGSIVPTSNIGTGGATPAPPTPINYLTNWKIVGNSEVHGVGNLTSWKVFGNSIVQDGVIMSCGDLGQDGKYHVKISNGVTIYDIPLTEPLRKVNSVADNITFANGTAVVIRHMGYVADISTLNFTTAGTNGYFSRTKLTLAKGRTETAGLLNPLYEWYAAQVWENTKISLSNNLEVCISERGITDINEFNAHIAGSPLIYELATPTTETVQVSPFPVSPTDTYTSANDTPYSAFEYKKNVEIWSCGEYSAVDGKYHILVQPLGGSIADIALDEPLRKVNDVADTIEFANGVAMPKRKFGSVILSNLFWRIQQINTSERYRFTTSSLVSVIKKTTDYANILTPLFDVAIADYVYIGRTQGISVAISGGIFLYDVNYNQADDLNAFLEHIQGVELIYELATPTTETIQVPQIAEADSYSCVISQGGKAVSWSSFETNSE